MLSDLLISAGILFAAGRQLGGLFGTHLAVLAVVSVLKALLFIRGKVSDTVLDWWGEQPTWVYRVWAASLFVLGCLMPLLLSVAETTP